MYIYREREKEREGEIHMYMCIYIYNVECCCATRPVSLSSACRLRTAYYLKADTRIDSLPRVSLMSFML